MKYLLSLTLLVSASVFAHEMSFGPYIELQESLAADDFKRAQVVHGKICAKELGHYANSYKDCKKIFKTIEDLRVSFKGLTDVYLAHGKKEDLKGLMKAYCPMYPGTWIQKEGKIANPYYGKAMLECGEKKSL